MEQSRTDGDGSNARGAEDKLKSAPKDKSSGINGKLVSTRFRST